MSSSSWSSSKDTDIYLARLAEISCELVENRRHVRMWQWSDVPDPGFRAIEFGFEDAEAFIIGVVKILLLSAKLLADRAAPNKQMSFKGIFHEEWKILRLQYERRFLNQQKVLTDFRKAPQVSIPGVFPVQFYAKEPLCGIVAIVQRLDSPEAKIMVNPGKSDGKVCFKYDFSTLDELYTGLEYTKTVLSLQEL